MMREKRLKRPCSSTAAAGGLGRGSERLGIGRGAHLVLVHCVAVQGSVLGLRLVALNHASS